MDDDVADSMPTLQIHNLGNVMENGTFIGFVCSSTGIGKIKDCHALKVNLVSQRFLQHECLCLCAGTLPTTSY